jgi:hypothetical protein
LYFLRLKIQFFLIFVNKPEEKMTRLPPFALAPVPAALL